jgi:DNA-directed RNA polymerase subunit RPC12/RpoP
LPGEAKKSEITCAACGFQNPPTQHFCGNCGTKLEVAPEEKKAPEVTCPNCGSKNRADLHFCGVCGANLLAPEPEKLPAVVDTAAAKPVATAHSTGSEVPVRPTWGLAWGIFWRIAVFLLLFGSIVYMVIYLLMLSNIIPPLPA